MHRIYLLVAILVLSFVDCFSQSYNLTFNLNKGKTYKLKQEVVQNTVQTIMGKVQKVETTISSVMAFDVKEKTNEFLLLDVYITDMIFKMKSPMFTMEYNSKQEVKEGDILGEIYSKVIGKKYSVLISKNGQVMQVEGLDKLINSIIEDSNVSTAEAKLQLNQSVKKMFGESVIKGNMEMLTYIFPKQNVAVGDKWSNHVRLETVMPVEFNNSWELKSVELNKVNILGKTDISSIKNDEWKMVNGIPTKYDIKGQQTSVINLDRTTGWIISSSMESFMKGNILMDKSDKLPQRMEIPIEINTKTKYQSIN